MRILLLSAYDAESHRYWHHGLVTHFPEHQFTVLTLPPRFFAWRIRGNSMSWAFGEERETLLKPYDLIISTSMTDLASLRGFLPQLASTPTVLYFHENQFAYPATQHAHTSVEPMMVTLYAALAADYIAFNTDYNRSTFIKGVSELLRKLPDQIPAGLPALLSAKSSVLPVPLPESCFFQHQPVTGPLRIAWNHRWEYDKGPELLLAALEQLEATNTHYVLSIVGQQFRKQPDEFETIHSRFSHRIIHWGYVASQAEYQQLLRSSDVVLSTADHDFQGIAVLEGVAAGAIPLVPDRLAYKELFADEFRYFGHTLSEEARAIATRLSALETLKANGQLPIAPCIRSLSWLSVKANYATMFAEAGCSSTKKGA